MTSTSLRLLGLALSLAVLAACSDSSTKPPGHCASTTDCTGTDRCVDGRCVATVTPDGGADAGFDGGVDGGPVCASPRVMCAAACCDLGDLCWMDTCIADRGSCVTGDDCESDTRCVGGLCVPWGAPVGEPTSDPACTRSINIDTIAPDVQCAWSEPPVGDPFPDSHQVMSTPVVVDFNLDDDPATLEPSIIFTTFGPGSYGAPGVLRVIDGRTCAHQFTSPLAEDAAMGPASPTVGDLDGDGRAEIVTARTGGGLVAYGWDATAHSFVKRWTSATCDAAGGRVPDTTGGADKWNGVSLHDLDDDGRAEIIYGATVYDANGCILSSTLGFALYSVGYIAVVADVDEDGRMELVQGQAIHEWRDGDWQPEPYFVGGTAAGQVAVADFGNFPLASLGGADAAEVAVISAGTARVQTLEGTVVFGPYTLPGGGTGGPPTIADFDGDGRAEFATAGGAQYIVFDLDCAGTPVGTCGSSRTDGILWTQPSKDLSSNVTGSSVFDFDANGAAEAVYADECFLRIYDGATGDVVYSAARSSGTTYENPVIVDVDGDFHSEIVTAANDYAGANGCPASDPLRPSTPFSTSHGILVLRDVTDRWAASRPVWNQHAYAVTNVGDRGEIPRTSAVARNWRTAGLNNFRQNVQGALDALGVPDLTTAAISERLRVPCELDGTATLRARVCNRGALPMAAGFVVEFRAETRDGVPLCRASSAVFLGVGECAETSCVAVLPTDRAIDVHVVADPDATSTECLEGNNYSLQPNVACDTIS